MDDDANAKGNVLRAAIDILPETLLSYRHDDLYDEVKMTLERAILEAPSMSARAIQNFAADALEDLLGKHGFDEPEVARSFLARLKREMGME